MLFNSFQFVLFYIVVLLVFFRLPQRHRWMLLLGASYFFYMCWKPQYIVLIIGVTLINYLAGIGLGRSESPAMRRVLVVSAAFSSLGILFTYKYVDFFTQSVASGLRSAGFQVEAPLLELLLPLGISFFTFQSLGYAIDVYRRTTPVERHLGIFALYVSFFPQLVAGPIERSGNLLPQFRRPTFVRADRVASGLRLMLWGAFKKIVIADHVGLVVDRVYLQPDEYSGPILLLATFFFSVQIYCDFSGYSDIAIGAARIMGFDLMTNFRRPYLATSVGEFWRRWHISLSTWFRDYVYLPLGGNRVTRVRWAINTMIVFLVSGIWHGANWTFVAWGAFHGMLLVIERLLRGPGTRLSSLTGLARLPRLHRVLKTASVFFLVLAGWVFFRAQSIDEAFFILSRWLDPTGFQLDTLWTLRLPRFEMMLAFLNIGVLFFVDWAVEFWPEPIERLWARRAVRWGLYLLAMFCVIFFGAFGGVDFIYFQF